MRVSQVGDDVMISAQPEETGQLSGGGFTIIDPLANVSFRTTLFREEDLVYLSIVASYVNNLYWDISSGWNHECFEIAPETLLVPSSFNYLYLKLPIQFYGGLGQGLSTGFPQQSFVSSAQLINGDDYVFSSTQTTGYTTRNQFFNPDSYYTLSGILLPPFALSPGDGGDYSGFFYFLIGSTTFSAFSQIHLEVTPA